MKMHSTTSSHFSQVPKAEIQRSSFDRSHGHKTTFDSGLLIPIFVDEALPGDTFNLNLTAFARLATPLKPVMDNMFMETFFFAVPNRLLWENWQRFNGEQRNPGDSTDYLVPQIDSEAGGFGAQTIFDYLGVPTLVPNLKINALHNRAYNLIYNEFFRDENLQDSNPVPQNDGPDHFSNYGLNKRGKRHDYFTSCLPWPQKGPAVEISLGGTIDIQSDGNPPLFENSNEIAPIYTSEFAGQNSNNSTIHFGALFTTAQPTDMLTWADPHLIGDLSTATTVTIAALRESFQIQKLYERDARGGTRYTEILNAHFQVTSPDARLQRPEYLGGGSTPVNLTIVPQTTNDDAATTPQANLAAYGTSTATGHGFTKSFTEHCVIIGMVCVRADLTYQQGLNRMFSRQTRWDFYWPALAHLGEQEVLNKEIYADGSANDDLIFGYQERYAEYRYKPSQITGQFRSNYPQSLDLWHLAQDFQNLPVLNSEFIEEKPPIDRVVAVPSEPEFLFDSYFKLNCVRPMPTYSVPGLVDHF